jgi:hypothetical protein
MVDDLRYPIGTFAPILPGTAEIRAASIAEIAALPQKMRAAIDGLTDARLDTPYREGGWTPRQVVHHVADSHMHGFIRVKLALTEDNPAIKPYDEKQWAQLADTWLPVTVSLDLLEVLHRRWVEIYRAMSPGQFARTFVHPEHGTTMTLDQHVQNYAWHCRHHVAHITGLRRRQGW